MARSSSAAPPPAGPRSPKSGTSRSRSSTSRAATSRSSGSRSPRSPTKRPLLQGIAAATGAAATLAVFGVLAAEALRPRAPAAVSTRVLEVRPGVPEPVAVVEVSNQGDETAADVRVEARSGDRTSEAVVDHLPGHGRAVVYLPLAPGAAAADVRTGGWSHP